MKILFKSSNFHFYQVVFLIMSLFVSVVVFSEYYKLGKIADYSYFIEILVLVPLFYLSFKKEFGNYIFKKSYQYIFPILTGLQGYRLLYLIWKSYSKNVSLFPHSLETVIDFYIELLIILILLGIMASVTAIKKGCEEA